MSYDIGVKRVAIVEGGLTQDTQMPVNISYRESTTIQTHNAVSVGATTGVADSSWIDCSGYDKFVVTCLNDASTNSNIELHWSNDGATIHGRQTLIPTNTLKEKVDVTDIKAKYCRVRLGNTDASAHTMSAWAYLKA